MSGAWNYQIRVYLGDAYYELARSDPGNPAIRPLTDVLARHNAALRCQFDAFAAYVAEAEQQGTEQFPLYRWTRETIDDPARKQKHLRAFAVTVDGEEVYAGDIADGLETSLQPLVGGDLVTRMSRHDTNPANNIPVPDHLR